MPRHDALHWIAATGEDWNYIAARTGATKSALGRVNRGLGYHFDGHEFNLQPANGDVLHIPLAGTP